MLAQVNHCQGDFGAQPVHCHEEIEFVAVYSGRGRLQRGRSRYDTRSGILAIVCPQEPHTGTPLTSDFAVKVINLPSEWLDAAQLDWRFLWRREAICTEPNSLAAFSRTYEVVQNHHSLLTQEEALLALYSAVSQLPVLADVSESKRIMQAHEILRERFSEEISLTALAAAVNLTPFYLCRAFKKSVGLSPHAYQNSLRVARAKTLLEKGKTPGEAAMEVGFYDQSHLNMHFKREYGITPAALQKAIFSYSSSALRE